ncbi:MAG: hypothetical protein AAGE92_13660, partial [Cyanobacteria bacterium P01_G01_bin.4]
AAAGGGAASTEAATAADRYDLLVSEILDSGRNWSGNELSESFLDNVKLVHELSAPCSKFFGVDKAECKGLHG